MISPRTPRRIAFTPAMRNRLAKHEYQHKYDHGHALVLSGPATRTGAARLSAMAALRAGAGLVTVGAPKNALGECASHLSAIMLRKVAGEGALAQLLKEEDRINALCVGPGFGLSPAQGRLLRAVLDDGRPSVIDADALTLLSQYEELFEAAHSACVLTPHSGEFRRLFDEISEDGSAEAKINAASQASQLSGAVIVYKGALTVVADQDRTALLDLSGSDRVPWLATAGAGDVLAGLIAGLLARGLAPFEAAQTGVLLHAEAARIFGPGLIAEDLPNMVPQVLRSWSVP